MAGGTALMGTPSKQGAEPTPSTLTLTPRAAASAAQSPGCLGSCPGCCGSCQASEPGVVPAGHKHSSRLAVPAVLLVGSVCEITQSLNLASTVHVCGIL